MTARLSDLIRPRGRFRRSANIDRDQHAGSLDGFIPTSRTLEAVGRVVEALEQAGGTQAISVTGPYGSGKSSLALFLTALLGPPGDSRTRADALLKDAETRVYERLVAVRSAHDRTGLILAVTSARREPVAETLARAVRQGLQSYRKACAGDDVGRLDEIDGDSVIDVLKSATELAPVLMVIDEFGKNLEEYVATRSAEADLYVLQEVAEWASGVLPNPFVLLTLQHLAFDDYIPTLDTGKRREWSKIQGRFVDVPYVDNSLQWQHLMASVYDYDSRLDISDWVTSANSIVDRAGLGAELHVPPDDIFPLHPLVAIALPELCVRYGQHERSLFSFLAGSDSGSVLNLLEERSDRELPLVFLDDVFDYFFDSTSQLAGSSAIASRAVEIATRVRDVVGCDPLEVRLLKTVAVLNLMSAGGRIRASRAVLVAALSTDPADTRFANALEGALDALEKRSILVFREFADEYRVWHGTDFDIRGALDARKAALEAESVASLVQRVVPAAPIIAARHSQLGGILRVFDRRFVDHNSAPELEVDAEYDGVVLLALGSSVTGLPAFQPLRDVPVLIGTSGATEPIGEAALELAACNDLLADTDSSGIDWVARRELSERSAIAEAELSTVIARAYSVGAPNLRWSQPGESRRRGRPAKSASLTEAISRLCDAEYSCAPIIRNEMISRRQLTSQGAQARRNLLEAMLHNPDRERFGIDGYGPERAMYDALFDRSGLHQRCASGEFVVACPKATEDPLNFRPTWLAIEELLEESEDRPIPIVDIYGRLMSAPYGLKQGPIPILIVAVLLASRESVAIFENGTFAPRIDVPLVERLIRNPEAFSARHYSPSGPRRLVLEAMFKEFSTGWRQSDDRSVRTLLAAVTPLLQSARGLNRYAQRTQAVSAKAQRVRTALLKATEPGDLLFRSLPEALGVAVFSSRDTIGVEEAAHFATQLKAAVDELDGSFGALLEHIEETVLRAMQASGSAPRSTVSRRAATWRQLAHEPDLRSLVFALTHDALDRDEWLSYLGMVVMGNPVASWGDEEAHHFASKLESMIRSLRRLESVAAIGEDTTNGYDVVQLGFTSQDHGDHTRVIWLNPDIMDDVEKVAIDAVRKVIAKHGPAAQEHLLAVLARTLLVESYSDHAPLASPNAPDGGTS